MQTSRVGGDTPSPLPFFPFPSFFPLSSTLKQAPLLRLGGLGSALTLPAGRQTVFGEFQALQISPLVATIFRSFSGNETTIRSAVDR